MVMKHIELCFVLQLTLFVSVDCANVTFCDWISPRSPPCRCDQKCELYRDCCPDYDPGISNNSVTNQSFSPVDADNMANSMAACHQVPGTTDRILFHGPLNDIHSPKWTDIKPRCFSPKLTDPYESTPVYNIMRDISYRNIFCAVLLDGYDRHRFIYWNVEAPITCYKKVLAVTMKVSSSDYNTFLDILFSGRICYPSFTYPIVSTPPRRCDCQYNRTDDNSQDNHEDEYLNERPSGEENERTNVRDSRSIDERPIIHSNRSLFDHSAMYGNRSVGDHSTMRRKRSPSTAYDLYIKCLVKYGREEPREDNVTLVQITGLSQRTARWPVPCHLSPCVDLNCTLHGQLFYYMDCIKPADTVRGLLYSFKIYLNFKTASPLVVDVIDIVQRHLESKTPLKQFMNATARLDTHEVKLVSKQGIDYEVYLSVVKQVKYSQVKLQTDMQTWLTYLNSRDECSQNNQEPCRRAGSDNEYWSVIVQLIVVFSAALVLFVILKITCKFARRKGDDSNQRSFEL